MSELKAELSKARALMIASRGNEVLPITTALMEQLKKTGQYNSSFGFQVRLVHGRALDNSSDGYASLEFLWKLKDDSRAYKEWKVLAEVCLEIALVNEIGKQTEDALQHLQEAKTVIDANQLDTVYGDYAVRYSSWNRMFGHRDTAYFYAQEAIRVGRENGIVDQEITGYLLCAFLVYGNKQVSLPDTIDRLKLSIEYRKKAAIGYKQLNNIFELATIHRNLSFAYFKQKNFQLALSHIDTSIYYYFSPEVAYDDTFAAAIYRMKADVLKAMGQLDSALVYYEKMYEAKLADLENDKGKQLEEIDKKYNVEKKNRELETEYLKNRLLLGIVILTVLFSAIALFYYFRLRKTNGLVKRQAEELKQLDELKSRFFANVSHELRTPLTLMLSPINSALKGGQLSNRDFTFLTIAQQNGKKLLKLIRSLLDLSKMEAGKLELEETPQLLFPLVRRLMGNFESFAQIEGVQFNFVYKADKDLQLEIDREKLEMVLNNLLSNAMKFTSSGGKVTFTVEDAKDKIKIAVADTGRGIHPDDLPHIFNRFYQSNAANATSEGGTGIGLALCQEFVKLMDGKIWAESVLGEGTQLFVELPRKEVMGVSQEVETIETPELEEQESVVPIVPLSENSPSISKPKILVVEDNYNLRDYLKLILSVHYEVLTASNGVKALAVLEACTASKQIADMPRLIVSDVMMPVMDGFQLLENLKKGDYAHIPVIMLTARAGTHDKLRALRIGVDDYMLKPFNEEELLARVQNLLSNYNLKTQAASTETITDNAAVVTPPKISVQDQEWLEKIEGILEAAVSNTNFSIAELADDLYISERQLRRRLKQFTGLSPQQYFKEIKMNKALKLLESERYQSVSEVSAAVGFKNPSSFSRSFVKRFGKKPSEYLYGV